MSANKSRRKSDEPDLSTLRASRDSTTDYSLEASISVGGRLHQSPTRSISSVDATPRGDIDASTFTTTSSQSRSPFDILASLAASELRSEDGGQASERGHNVSATATPRGVASASVTPRGVNEPFPRLHASPARRSVTMTIGSLSNVRFGTVFDNETGLVMIPVNPSSSADMEIDGVVKRCAWCFTSETPQWRRSRETDEELCNSCGLKASRQQRRTRQNNQGGGGGGGGELHL